LMLLPWIISCHDPIGENFGTHAAPYHGFLVLPIEAVPPDFKEISHHYSKSEYEISFMKIVAGKRIDLDIAEGDSIMFVHTGAELVQEFTHQGVTGQVYIFHNKKTQETSFNLIWLNPPKQRVLISLTQTPTNEYSPENLIKILKSMISWTVSQEATAEREKITELKELKDRREKVAESKELKHRGKELRKAIDEEYNRLANANELKIMGQGRNNITDTVVQYIPIGTSFDDAEAILMVAGFDVGERTMDYANKPIVFSKISTYKLTPLFAGTSVSVVLQPKNKDDWSTVQRIEADFNIVYP